jgi:hypothetical protein
MKSKHSQRTLDTEQTYGKIYQTLEVLDNEEERQSLSTLE